jgi:hypothetical protein
VKDRSRVSSFCVRVAGELARRITTEYGEQARRLNAEMQTPQNPRACNRRELLRTAARWSVAAGIGGVCALLVWGRRNSPDGPCIRPLACGNCDQFTDCQLPKAWQARRNSGGANG